MSVPVERKTALGSASGMAVGALVWALTTFVPLFHGGLPPELYGFVAWIVPQAVTAVVSYLSKHTPREPEPPAT